MAHPQTAEAVDAPVDDMDSAAAAIGRLDLGGDKPQEDEQPAPAADDEHGDDQDDLDLSDDEDSGDNEPGDPAIDAPASLTAEEKTKFAALPKEAQRYIVDLEGRRATQVQQATTKAADAQRNAEAAAARADAEARAVYARQLKALGDQIAPQRPDPMLAHTDPATFIALNAQYDAAKAQHDEFMQQVAGVQNEAQSGIDQAFVQQRDRELLSIPEVANTETRDGFFEKALGVAQTLGLDMQALNSATAHELKALRSIHDWKDKAEKYDSAMARQMKRVRDGKKTQATKPNAAQPSSSEGRVARDAKERLRQTGDWRDAGRAIAALG